MLNLTAQNWTEATNSPIPILIDFWAPWCKPCKALEPILLALEEEFAGKVKFAKVNADEEATLSAKCGVQSLPTLLIVKGEAMLWRHTGAITKDELRKQIQAVL